MKIYTRHILKSFVGLFLLIFLCSVTVYVVIDFVGNSRVWLARPAAERYAYYLNSLPDIAYLTAPISLLLAAVFSVGGLARHLELVALKSAGVSMTRILFPVFVVGALLSGAMFYLQDRVLPDANHRRYQIQEPGAGMFSGSDPSERANYLYTSADRTLVYFQYYNGARTTGTVVTALRLEHDRPKLRIDAAQVVWSDSIWVFQSGTAREFHGDSVSAKAFETWTLPGFRDPPKDILDARVYPGEMSLAELSRRIAVLKRNGEPSHALETHWHFRFASALVCFLMTLIGSVLAVNTVRGGLARNFGFGLLIFFLYYVTARLGLVVGENGGLRPWVAAWLANLLFFPVALSLWFKASRA